ncbi:uncharacterized protein LOC112680389 isoform X1 [Sipha flava]|uniref:Uncharacterized protein LOC112680389 isoform X1 n=1 Tax=Sipha flava TaxID=143950 RepID=A0A8B8F5Z7_9HEMI|nr:uncharacterized protein LOC112680389 isoform X1 [Sipha flava]
MIFMYFFSSDRRSISAQEMDRNDKRLQLKAFCFICGWPQFLVWLTKDQARRVFAHHGCCAGLEEPQNGALAHDDVGGRSAPSPAAFSDCGSQTDPVSVTVPVANRDFGCGNSCVRFVNVCTQTYPFVGKVASDVNESITRRRILHRFTMRSTR